MIRLGLQRLRASDLVIKARLYAVLGILAALIGVLALLYRVGPHSGILPKCLLKSWTGYHCPGCGMTRAVDATLHGRIAEAFAYNPVIMTLLPLVMLMIGVELVAWVRGRPPLIRIRVTVKLAWCILGVVVLFGILRNIPAWPFTLLGP